MDPRRLEAKFDGRGHERRRAPSGSDIVARDHRELPASSIVEKAADAAGGGLVREADQGVDGRRRQVPGLDDGDAGPDQLSPHGVRMDHAGQDDARRPAADDCVNKLLFARVFVAALAENELVARRVEGLRQGLYGFVEDGADQRRHDRGDQPVLAGFQAPRHQVGNVAGLLDGQPDFFQRLLVDLAGRAQRTGDGHRRDARQQRHVIHRGAGVDAPSSARRVTFGRFLGHCSRPVCGCVVPLSPGAVASPFC